jgi:Holliday junction resolvase
MGQNYERELRLVLSGKKKNVEGVLRSCTIEEKNRMRMVLRKPFFVIRVAGSGIEGSGDVFAARGDYGFPIEVKSSHSEKLYFDERLREQYNAILRDCQKSELLPLYAFRLKGVRGDSWRIFRVETGAITARQWQIAQRIPPLPTTNTGSVYLNWNDGLPLNKFISMICYDDSETTSQDEIRDPIFDEAMKRSQIFAELERRRSESKVFKSKV